MTWEETCEHIAAGTGSTDEVLDACRLLNGRLVLIGSKNDVPRFVRETCQMALDLLASFAAANLRLTEKRKEQRP